MHRDRITLIALSFGLALGVAVSCTDSEPVNPGSQTGKAGSTGSGAAGNTGAGTAGAGNTQGTAGAGNTQGGAGSTGAAGAGNTGGGGSTGTAGAGNTGGSLTGNGGSGGSAGGSGGSATGHGGSGGSATGNGGSGGGAGGSMGATVSFANDIYPFIMTQCMPCHTKATNQDGGPLDMSSASKAYASLLGTATPVTGAPAKTDTGCKLLDSKKLRVEPTDPMHSYIYIKITNSDTTLMGMNCGPAMPETASKLTLTADQKQKISDWITQGAKNN
ncbi:MAG TPA: hypothetical protein VHL80_10560 [Polyangia bacterium]|nr:hypothetical protein [Polyangia bacterium]